MKFGFEVRTNVVVDADTREEAEKKLKAKIDEKHSRFSFDGIYDEDGNKLSRVMNRKTFQWVWYKPSCPVGYTDCILDPARSKAQKYGGLVLPDGLVEPCKYAPPEASINDCDDYDDECK